MLFFFKLGLIIGFLMAIKEDLEAVIEHTRFHVNANE